MHRGNRSARKGFTLVELLVVMVIIGILATLLVVGVMAAMRAAREARIRTEIMGLAAAIETYKGTYGEYPPSSSGELQTHIDRLFPRNQDTVPTGIDNSKILVFCLSGYSSDPRHPLTGTGVKSYFDFDYKRLKNDSGEEFNPEVVTSPRGYKYIPPSSDIDIPYVYFRKQWDNTTKSYTWQNQSFNAGDAGTVTAKKISKDFQIVCAGLEDKFGVEDITSYQDGTEEED